MATLRDLRNRIKGVKNTQQITKAMKMVSASKLRRAQDAIMNAKPFSSKVSKIIQNVISDDDRTNNPLLLEREAKSVLVVVITADRGLCGAFNTNIIRESNNYVKKLRAEGKDVAVYCVGKKGFDFFKKTDFRMFGKTIGLFNSLKFDYVTAITPPIIKSFISGEFDKVVFIHNEFVAVASQKVRIKQFLPVLVEEGEVVSNDFFIYEPDQKTILNKLLPRYIETSLWTALLDSNAAEFGARMTAMENATTNASELITTLKTTYNKARQAAITKEILEIVSGANALRG